MFEMANAVCSLQWRFANLNKYAAHAGSEQVKQEEERCCVTVIGSNNNYLYISITHLLQHKFPQSKFQQVQG